MNNTDLTTYTNDNNNLVNLGFIFDTARMIKSFNNGNILDY